jgi:hypothetical protein
VYPERGISAWPRIVIEEPELSIKVIPIKREVTPLWLLKAL